MPLSEARAQQREPALANEATRRGGRNRGMGRQGRNRRPSFDYDAALYEIDSLMTQASPTSSTGYDSLPHLQDLSFSAKPVAQKTLEYSRPQPIDNGNNSNESKLIHRTTSSTRSSNLANSPPSLTTDSWEPLSVRLPSPLDIRTSSPSNVSPSYTSSASKKTPSPNIASYPQSYRENGNIIYGRVSSLANESPTDETSTPSSIHLGEEEEVSGESSVDMDDILEAEVYTDHDDSLQNEFHPDINLQERKHVEIRYAAKTPIQVISMLQDTKEVDSRPKQKGVRIDPQFLSPVSLMSKPSIEPAEAGITMEIVKDGRKFQRLIMKNTSQQAILQSLNVPEDSFHLYEVVNNIIRRPLREWENLYKTASKWTAGGREFHCLPSHDFETHTTKPSSLRAKYPTMQSWLWMFTGKAFQTVFVVLKEHRLYFSRPDDRVYFPHIP